MLRIDAAPTPSAAHTRWQVAAAPSQPLEANAPGIPALDLTLLRQRGGAGGQHWCVEWDRDARGFAEAPLPGVMVPLAEHGSAAACGTRWRPPPRAGRKAARGDAAH